MKTISVNQHNQRVGKWGETCAAEYLQNQGFVIIDRNIRTPEGEIDLIAQKEDMVVFVEVKTRTNERAGYPEEAVTEEKLEHMTNSAEWFMQEHSGLGENWRIDVIAIIGKIGLDAPIIEWFQDAV
ncbi:MAG: hypothetical protein FD147_183 [Chloroflexi bacterium]|nr:MAG: hypothetical protein FD147_183 [Chloroflexota bacterium]